MVLSVPMMRELFYEPSKVWMRNLQPYKTNEITQVMQVLSVIGDGQLYFYILIAITFGLGKRYEFTYLTLCFLLNFHW